MANIDLSRVPDFFHNYIKLVADEDLAISFKKHQVNFISILKNVPEEMWDYRYAEGKWTIKELIQHVIDAERIFSYRALRFARKDDTGLAGFDENKYAQTARADKRSKEDLIEELGIVQRSSALLFASFDEDQLEQSGISNGKSIYVKAIGYIITGHTLHHQNILLERYLNKKPSTLS